MELLANSGVVAGGLLIVRLDVCVELRGAVEDEAGHQAVVGVEFLIDGGEGAELEAGDVGEDGSAAGGDAVFDHEAGEGAEEVVHLAGGFEIEGIGAEMGGEVDVGDLRWGVLRLGVLGTEQGVFQNGKAAALAGRMAVNAGGAGE